MKTVIVLIVFLLAPAAFAQIMIETPNGEQRLRYDLCDAQNKCRTVEQVMNYPICDEHHNCLTVDAFESGKARVLEEEEWGNETVVFTVPNWM